MKIGVGLEAALLNFGAWMQPGKTATLYCRMPCTDRKGCNIPDCFDSYNGSGDNNSLIDSYDSNEIAGRAWRWLQCNEPLGYWQTSSKHLNTYKLKHANSVNLLQWGTLRGINNGFTSHNVLLFAAAMFGILPGS
jgi:hypothetical protein